MLFNKRDCWLCKSATYLTLLYFTAATLLLFTCFHKQVKASSKEEVKKKYRRSKEEIQKKYRGKGGVASVQTLD